MQKNDKITVRITDMAVGGEGIGKSDGLTYFVKNALIGDTAEAVVTKVKGSYAFAKMTKLINPSPARVKAPCPVARQCGGCQLQELSYEAQLDFKFKSVRDCLIRIGGISPEAADEALEPALGADETFHYRNKAQYPVGKDSAGNPTAGFFAGRTHHVIPCLKCELSPAEDEKILRAVLDFMKANNISPYDETTESGLVRHVLVRHAFSTHEIMVCVVINGDRLPRAKALAGILSQIPGVTGVSYNINKDRTNVVTGKEVRMIWGKDHVTDIIDGMAYRISPLSFYQVNYAQTKRLYETVREYADLKGGETVWDIYCGIGTISLLLASKAESVLGVEVSARAVRDARENARMNNIENVSFSAGRAEDLLPRYRADYRRVNGGEARADVVVLDPPRKGCATAVLDAVVGMSPKKIVYVSCDAATLARDIKYLSGGGYALTRVRPVDMFPQTVHVETVCALSRIK